MKYISGHDGFFSSVLYFQVMYMLDKKKQTKDFVLVIQQMQIKVPISLQSSISF